VFEEEIIPKFKRSQVRLLPILMQEVGLFSREGSGLFFFFFFVLEGFVFG